MHRKRSIEGERSREQSVSRLVLTGLVLFTLFSVGLEPAARAQQAAFLGWFTEAIDQDSEGIGSVAFVDENFGGALVGGDFDCDGFDDLAVSAPNQGRLLPPDFTESDPSVGLVHVVFGSADGLSSRSVSIGEFVLDDLADGPEAYDRIGEVLAVGNFNGDSLNGHECDDLAIGSPLEDVGDIVDAGQVWVLYGGPDTVVGGGSLLEADTFHQGFLLVEGMLEDYDEFGRAMVAGDFNGDGFDELAVSAPYDSLDGEGIVFSGGVWVFSGASGGLVTLNEAVGWVQLLSQENDEVPGRAESNDHFGSSLAACDLDGDGVDDLLIGVSGEDLELATTFGDTGAVVALLGRPAIADALGGFSPPLQSSRVRSVTAGDRLGSSLATRHLLAPGVGSLCNVLSGSPGFDAFDGETVVDAGKFSEFEWQPGSPGELRLHRSDDELSLGGVARANDLFGSAVASGDFDSDGNDEILIGVPGKDYLEGFLDNAGAFYWFLPRETANLSSFVSPYEYLPRDPGGRFGHAFAVADFNGDGIDDLAVAAPTQSDGTIPLGAGQVRLYLSGNTAIFLDGFEEGDVSAWQ